MTLTFNDCQRTVTIDETTYTITIAGTATAAVTGSASGNGETISQASFATTFSGTPAVSGDVTGTVDLTSFSFSGEFSGGEEPVGSCEGTTGVTLDGTE